MPLERLGESQFGSISIVSLVFEFGPFCPLLSFSHRKLTKA